jgi:MFS transporter, SP family, sugar:H+ symporter
MLGCMAAPFINKKWGRKGAMLSIATIGILGGLIEMLSTFPQ